MEKLTHQEEEIMLVIWKKKRGIIKDFLEQLPKPPTRQSLRLSKIWRKKDFCRAKK
mgnify:CR=1 FL=1